MPITRTPMIDDDGTGTTGTIINNAWKQEFYGQIDAFGAPMGTMGVWQAEPFNAANFSAGGSMTWTVAAGALATNRYTVIGQTMIWSLYVIEGATSVIGGTISGNLLLRIPGGKSMAFYNPGPVAHTSNNGGHQIAEAIFSDNTHLMIVNYSGPWVTGPVGVRFTLSLEIA